MSKNIYSTDAVNDNDDPDAEADDRIVTLGDCERCAAVNVTLYRVRYEWLCAKCAGVEDEEDWNYDNDPQGPEDTDYEEDAEILDAEYERAAEDAERKADAAEDWE